MADTDPAVPSVIGSIVASIDLLEEYDNHVLSEAQVDFLMETTKFMHNSFKSLSGVFVNGEDRVQVVRVIGQIAENFDLMGLLKYKQAIDVHLL